MRKTANTVVHPDFKCGCCSKQRIIFATRTIRKTRATPRAPTFPASIVNVMTTSMMEVKVMKRSNAFHLDQREQVESLKCCPCLVSTDSMSLVQSPTVSLDTKSVHNFDNLHLQNSKNKMIFFSTCLRFPSVSPFLTSPSRPPIHHTSATTLPHTTPHTALAASCGS